MIRTDGRTEKLDALDLVINVVKSHEKKLDDLVYRLEDVTFFLEELREKTKGGK